MIFLNVKKVLAHLKRKTLVIVYINISIIIMLSSVTRNVRTLWPIVRNTLKLTQCLETLA